MTSTPLSPASTSRVRAAATLMLVVGIVLSFALLSGPALTTVGVLTVLASALGVGHAIGTGKRTSRSPQPAAARA